MEEQKITFETAKIAKEKRFGYDFGGTDYVDGFYCEEDSSEFKEFEMQQEDACRVDYYLRPTQSMLQRWLREVHKKIVLVKFCCDGDDFEDVRYWVDVSEFEHFKTHDSFVSVEFETYEEALEKGLFEALKLIK